MKTTNFLNSINEEDVKHFVMLASEYSARAYFEIKYKSPMFVNVKKTKDEKLRPVFRVDFMDEKGAVKDSEDYGEFFISSDENYEGNLTTISIQERRWYNFVAEKNAGKTNEKGQTYTQALQGYYNDIMTGKLLAKMNEIEGFMGNPSYMVREKPKTNYKPLKAKY